MLNNKISNEKVGAALVVGGGIGGMQAALDLAEAGIKVYLVENKPSIGGRMSQLDKTFPTNDCAMCTMAPRLVEIGRNKDIKILTLSDIEKVAGEPGNFRVTLKKRARYIDEEKCTGCGECQEACPIKILDEYNMNIIETRAIYRRYPQAVPNTFAIEKLGQSPCRFACPAGQKVQGYIALIREKRYEDAYHVIVRDNPFPSVCGRVCKHYCEDECTRARVDEPVSIMNLKRFVADWAYERKLTHKKPVSETENIQNSRKRVAIIGSGPAGLTAARDLRDSGYSVTIFEALSEPGGMMRFGVPEFRLPRERLKWDIQNILSHGIELKTNHRVNSIDSLRQDGFDAVFGFTSFRRVHSLLPLRSK
ncbi:MAG: NAD(P)-binding protein [bacterium]